MGINWNRDDPVADAEEAATDKRPVLGHCEVCGCEIHGSTEFYDPDDAFCIEGAYICFDHLHNYFIDCKLK